MALVSRGSAGDGSGAEPLSHDAGDEDWLSRLARSPLVRGDVVALARELPERAPQLVARALEFHGPHAASVLAFACAVRSWAIPRAALLALIPEVDHPEHAVALMHHADVDPVTLALELAEQGQLSNERLALAALERPPARRDHPAPRGWSSGTSRPAVPG